MITTNVGRTDMAYDTDFAERLEALVARDFAATGLLQRTTMFGGLGFLLDGKMCMKILTTVNV